jgi:hypothetical protein
MRYRAPWDSEEAFTAKRLRDEGVNDEEIAYYLGRTVAGVRRALVRFFGPEARLISHGYEVGPAIGRTMECQRLEQDAKLGSQILCQAINDLINSMDADQVAFVLGAAPNVIPGRERIYKTASIERLAA